MSFARDVRPILASKCFACHGADEESREADLRLDTRDGATGGAENPAVVPGAPERSELLARVTSPDPDVRMPPADAGKPLTQAEVEVLRRWIAAGAEYSRHWAYVTPRRPEVPQVGQADWPRNPIDHFVLARVEAADLSPNPSADRYTLVRRLYLDLTGIPPTPEQAEAFVQDDSPIAYEALVDRLLASDAYGEHWARMWLDLARYADTKGYEKDQEREIWRYRDWVIDAFRRDMPYDQFTRDQLAGDLLPAPNPDQLLATAFHRNTMTNDEGGTDNEEFRVAAVKDRVDTTIQVWMGLTMGCAKCHSHKFDPISQEDYYRFFAVFNQTEDADRSDDSPRAPSPTPEQLARQTQMQDELSQLRRRYEQDGPEFEAAFAEWQAQAAEQRWTPLAVTSATAQSGATLSIRSDHSVLASGKLEATDEYVLTARVPLERITALRIEALTDESLEKQGPGRNGDDPNFVLNELTVELKVGEQPSREVKLNNARADFSQKNWSVEGAIDGDPKSGWAISPSFGKRHAAVFDLAEPADGTEGGLLTLRLSQQYGQSLVLGCFRLLVSDQEDTAILLPTPVTLAELASLPADQRTPQQQKKLQDAFREVYPPTRDLAKQIATVEKKLADLEKQIPKTPVMRELPENRRRATHVHVRGNFLEPGLEVSAGVPEAFAAGSTVSTRLEAADWLMSDDNPLTARVAVNRYWARLFGRGLVETEEDFGLQGALPSHPQLLDWLAVEFRDTHDWSMKQLCKTIVMSATYRQSTEVREEHRQRDPDNRWLARFPRVRLPAETIRDQALAAAGLLSSKVGGPSVMPPQPPGIWRTTYSKLKWETSEGADRYRRALYTFWRRTSPYPSMITFDAGSREVCVVRRVRTNTPLQALVTLNDPVFVEAAGGVGRQMQELADASVEERLRYGFQRVLVRPPEPAEMGWLGQLFEEVGEQFRADPKAARQLLEAAGVTPAESPEVAATQAAFTVVGNVLLNLDETLMRN